MLSSQLHAYITFPSITCLTSSSRVDVIFTTFKVSITCKCYILTNFNSNIMEVPRIDNHGFHKLNTQFSYIYIYIWMSNSPISYIKSSLEKLPVLSWNPMAPRGVWNNLNRWSPMGFFGSDFFKYPEPLTAGSLILIFPPKYPEWTDIWKKFNELSPHYWLGGSLNSTENCFLATYHPSFIHRALVGGVLVDVGRLLESGTEILLDYQPGIMSILVC